ncbi:LysR family transcriptional regulator [Pseudomaricurvus alkylphenolicus]|uniref:LysR family transcriptional regulator n=1 Tax=Pseudomaricurvus alkylphenolicus TaxID=1306991 RepID=UPI00141EC255|nr:LysR family transcriptional regulator [Pseudomaricurvus alkylphenolicus]NIB43073.1 LysR family transcriptional regulator [Pseudomaricurvus alkylphenolicus]
MKLQQLRYFVAVYEEGSVTSGATRAHATQSGLSMQIKDLEEQFGGPLFERSAKGVVPTEMGRRFYGYATQILRGVSEATQAMKAMQGEISGSVKAGLMPTFTRSVLPPALIQFSDEYPLVQTSVLEAYSAQLTRDVVQGLLDFAVVPAPASGEDTRIRYHLMGSDPEFLVSAPGGEHLTPVDLAKIGPLKLVLPGPDNARRAKIDAYLQTHSIEVAAILELDAMLGTLELVAHSDWKTILPGILCSADKGGEVRQLNPIVGGPSHVDYVMIEPKAASLSPAAQIFAEKLQQELDRQLVWHQNI